MKTMFTVLSVACVLAGCGNDAPQKTQKPNLADSIKTRLAIEIADMKSYEPVSTTLLDSTLDGEKVCTYEFKHRFKANNKFGALVFEEVYVQTNARFRIFRLTRHFEYKEKNPCEFVKENNF